MVLYGLYSSLGDTEAIALHDCDIITYDRNLLARLVYPVANPDLILTFVKVIIQEFQKKGPRKSSKITVTPLLRALEKTIGFKEYISL